MERVKKQNTLGKNGKPPARRSKRVKAVKEAARLAIYNNFPTIPGVETLQHEAGLGGKALKSHQYGEKKVVDLAGPKKLGAYTPTIKPGDIIQYPMYPFGNIANGFVVEVHPNQECPIFVGEKKHFTLYGHFTFMETNTRIRRVAEMIPNGKHVPITEPGESHWVSSDSAKYLPGTIPKDYAIPDNFDSFTNDVARAWTSIQKRASSYCATKDYSSPQSGQVGAGMNDNVEVICIDVDDKEVIVIHDDTDEESYFEECNQSRDVIVID